MSHIPIGKLHWRLRVGLGHNSAQARAYGNGAGPYYTPAPHDKTWAEVELKRPPISSKEYIASIRLYRAAKTVEDMHHPLILKFGWGERPVGIEHNMKVSLETYAHVIPDILHWED